MICKICKIEKVKKRAERRTGLNSYYHRDEKGRMWHGYICPDCYWTKGVSYKKDKDENEMHPDKHFDPNPLTKRKCRKCFNFLPANKYFKHDWCVSEAIDPIIFGGLFDGFSQDYTEK